MNGKALVTLLLLTLTLKLQAQQFGGFPPSTRWQQLNTDTARIIHTGTVTPQAERVAAIIHKMARAEANPLGQTVRKIAIVLHPNTTLANGYVALAPFRSEYYLIPSSNIFEFGATPWHEELAVHEFRHVQQYSNFNKGLSRVAGVLLGEQGQALFNALAVPDWFFEGDAVHSETALTAQGRGRAPYFFNGFRALWQDGRTYSWMKWRNGSLKDFVPNHYNLGYLLTNYGYLRYGAGFWGKVADDASRFRHLFYPFQHAVKKEAGIDYTTFRNEAFAYYQKKVNTKTGADRKRETVAHYLFPQQIGRDSLLYIKSAYNSIPAFYLRDGRGEHRLKQRNITSEDWLSYRNGTVAYTGFGVNPRWSLTDYSDIYLLDIRTGQERKLTRRGRYFTPDLSPSGNEVIAVAFNDSAESELRLLNMEGGVRRRIKAEHRGDLFVHPRFATDLSFIVAVRHTDGSMSLQRGAIPMGEKDTVTFQPLIDHSPATIGYPFVAGNSVYFVSSASGNDDIYAADIDSLGSAGNFRQLTMGVTGNYYPSVYNDSLAWSHFTSNGFRIEKADLRLRPVVVVSREFFRRRVLPYNVADDAGTPNLLQTAGVAGYPVTAYKKGTGLFNFHSRQATYTDPELTAGIFSDNILNTFSNEIFYRYNRNELSHAIGFTSFYGGLYPVLHAGFTYTANRHLKTSTKTYTLDQKELRLGYSVPLNFSGGKTVKGLSFGTDYVYTETTPTGGSKLLLSPKSFSYLSHFISWSEQLPRARQQLFPAFGYAATFSHRHLLGNNGFQFLGGTRFYLPSVKNHSVVLAANWQETDTSNVVFSNRFANSRGYNDYFFSRMWRLSGNYHMPLFYPDWGFANIVYFLRVRSNVFYDYTRVYSAKKTASRNQRSVGGELYFDTRWWNQLPVSFGVRMSHLLDDDFSKARPAGSNFFEFIIPIDLIPR